MNNKQTTLKMLGITALLLLSTITLVTANEYQQNENYQGDLLLFIFRTSENVDNQRPDILIEYLKPDDFDDDARLMLPDGTIINPNHMNLPYLNLNDPPETFQLTPTCKAANCSDPEDLSSAPVSNCPPSSESNERCPDLTSAQWREKWPHATDYCTQPLMPCGAGMSMTDAKWCAYCLWYYPAEFERICGEPL